MKWIVAAAAPIAVLAVLLAPAFAYASQEEDELQIGRQVYQQLESRHQIVGASPSYAILTPLGRRIAVVADKQYFAPAHFILIRGNEPNAFAVPGGNVYVTESMMKFVQNKEELAGVLCHEVSHNIHHDVYDLYVKSKRISLYATLAQLLLGSRSPVTSFAIDFLANVQALRFSRVVERNADETGAYVCAEAGITPWGMVWLMKQFLAHPSSKPPEFLSDHPTDSHRMADLERLFEEHPQPFAPFNTEIALATPLTHPDLRDQYKAKPQAAEAAAPPPRPKASPRRAPAAKPTCPPGWKFCPPGARK